MTPEEIVSARKQLGLSQAGLAAELGLANDRTVRRWEAGEIPITGPAELCIRYMLMYGFLPD
jgi:DNA-binding transcriptional regulator YiaG